jgi:hypothetical protein
MGYSKSVGCDTNGCPHSFDVVVSRVGEDIEDGRCPKCGQTTRMYFSSGSLDHKELV